MKIGILTFPNSPSYGATLQMNALYYALQNLGVDVEIINYCNTYMAQKKHIKQQRVNPLKTALIGLLDLPAKKKFLAFERELNFFPNKILCEKDNLKNIADRFDYLICGSDQVWNPKVTGNDLNYFFSFCGDGFKKISYAASFGVNELDDSYAQKVKDELKTFSRISVREEQGAKIVGDLLGNNCEIVLDPTMLIPQSEWRSREMKVSGLPERYIARFIFNHDDEVEKRIEELGKQTGLPIVTVGGTLISRLKNKLYTGPIGPREWLYVLDHADYVVTDSFHGAAFSIIFHKNAFFSLASSTNSRLKTLLKTFGLMNRVIPETDDDTDIDYGFVQKVMDEKRENSLEFLKKAINLEDIYEESAT